LTLQTNGSTTAVTIDTSQNVGIGTSSPGSIIGGKCLNLYNTGTATLSIQAVDGGNDRFATLELLSSGNGGSYSQILFGDTDTTPGTPSPLVFAGYHSGTRTERMRISSTGNVGIGTNVPSNPLHIYNANANINLLYLENNNTYTSTALGGEGPIKLRNINTTSGNMATISNYDGNGNINAQINFVNVNHSGSGEIAFTTRSGGSYPEAMRISSDRRVFVGTTATPGGSNPVKFAAVNSATGEHIGSFVAATTSYTSQVFILGCTRTATSGFNLGGWYSGDGGNTAFQDAEFIFRGDGQGYADGTWNNNGADYAEFFESITGESIPVGSTVVLDNNKVRLATESDNADDIIGVVRPKEPSKASMVVGNTAWNKWANKYLTDDFDRYIMEDHDVIEWTDEEGKNHSYESHNIPANVVVPTDVTVKTHDEKGNKFQHYKLNPEWDPNVEYVNRENRDEWLIIGLVGQVKILKGQKMGSRWVKMRDVSQSVEEWFIR
jgi:hypothetical protein